MRGSIGSKASDKKHYRGFTIVELLIVVVVIAILAAITVVTYNGIQARALESAIQADLRQSMSKLEQYRVVNGLFPTANDNDIDTAELIVSKGLYNQSSVNYLYCARSDRSKAALSVVASSGIRYQYESSGGFSRYAGSVSFSDYTALCSSLTGSGSFERYGFSLGNGDWRNWTR